VRSRSHPWASTAPPRRPTPRREAGVVLVLALSSPGHRRARRVRDDARRATATATAASRAPSSMPRTKPSPSPVARSPRPSARECDDDARARRPSTLVAPRRRGWVRVEAFVSSFVVARAPSTVRYGPPTCRLEECPPRCDSRGRTIAARARSSVENATATATATRGAQI